MDVASPEAYDIGGVGVLVIAGAADMSSMDDERRLSMRSDVYRQAVKPPAVEISYVPTSRELCCMEELYV